jgi:NTP pyrophosphatase (non-canonical NTP hydrolase)
MDEKSFQKVVEKTRKVIKRFEKIEGKPWGINGAMIELMKQVGQLSTLVMMQEQYYPTDRDKDDPQYQVSKEKIADELSDLLFMTIRIADVYGIDLEDSHIKALKSAEDYLSSKGV